MISRGTETMIWFLKFVLYCVTWLGNLALEEGFIEDFSEQMETAIRAILCAIQNLAERNSKKAEENTDQTGPQEEDGTSEIRGKISFRLDSVFIWWSIFMAKYLRTNVGNDYWMNEDERGLFSVIHHVVLFCEWKKQLVFGDCSQDIW